jgi:nitrate/nitrite transporter NarK
VVAGRGWCLGGFVHLIANLAGIVAPAVTGYIIEWTGSYAGAFVLTGAIAILGALSVAVFVRAPAKAGAPVSVPGSLAGVALPRR